MEPLAVDVATAAPYRVQIGPGVLSLAAAAAGDARALVLTDANVEPLHRERLSGLAEAPTVAVEPGETSKSLGAVEEVLEAMATAGLDRTSALVALGGGVVGDLGGLAASLYMRGIDVVQCPTTLLAQVDAAVGGKTAVNLAAGKNLAGTFHQPRAVFVDTAVLATLPEEELAAGFGETIKTALIGGEELLDKVEAAADRLLARDPDALAEVVAGCVRVKAAVVAGDERERGSRKVLNLGHTFAHAIEHAAGYGRIPHGVAVGTGLALALAASRRLGILEDGDLPARVRTLLERLGLCPTLGGLRSRYDVPLEPNSLVAGLRHDKKGRAGAPFLVVPRAVGAIELDVPADGEALQAIFGA